MRFVKALAFITSVIFFLNMIFVGVAPGAQTRDVEQQLIEEILTLDARVLALQNEVDKLSIQNQKLRKELEQKQKELSLLNSNFNIRQKELSRLIVFSFKGGMGNMLSVLVGAENLGDFFRRFDNIMFFIEYYNNVIIETKALINHRKQEERNIMEKQWEIQSLEKQAKLALEKITQTIAKKQKELRHARLVLKDTAFLEEISEDWQESLPSLDYLLKNLSSLPWSSLSPDNLKVNYFAMTARAEFFDTSVTKTLLSKDENLKDVYFTFHSEGITVTERKPNSKTPVYSITCSMELTEDQKIQFAPKRLEFSGVTLPAKVINELMADYDMVFSPPPLPYDLKITSISTEDGKLIMNFKK
ncbi:MAG: hypothetical protein PHE70_10195 [Tepidanaerobacteraceae bacterium]|nr:hypothetical protein [Tepidanaerobacteraceae bacterium]